MTFHDWIYSNYPENSAIKGQWGWLHILTLILCVELIVIIALLFRKKKEKTRRYVLYVIAGLILFFELARRVINLSRGGEMDLSRLLYLLLPRPWCAISCWLMMLSVVVHKKFLYNFVSMSALLCTLIFFAYPSVGFNDRYILFENLYSIATHSLLLIGSITLITLKFADFKFDGSFKRCGLKELLVLAAVFAYAIFEIVCDIEGDPLYFMPGNDVQEILGLPYPLYLVIYAVFLAVYFLAFYVVHTWLAKRRKKAA